MQNAVLSLGMGVESCAILIRWAYEPETRPCPIEHLTVITAQTGDEFLSTARDMINYILPLMREHKIPYVQVARRGPKEAHGITVLSDTREPFTLHIKGDYKLSDELAASGVVPSYSGAHTCSMKSKAAVIEKWLNEHYENETFGHAFGYNTEEPKRILKSDEAFPIRNIAFGFSVEEIGRAHVHEFTTRLSAWDSTRESSGDGTAKCASSTSSRRPEPSEKNRAASIVHSRTKENLIALEARHNAHPQQTADALMLEHMSLALNPRGTLYRVETLKAMISRAGNTEALELFHKMLSADEWAIYRVRRIYSAKAGSQVAGAAQKGTVQRAVEKLRVFATGDDAVAELERQARQSGWELELEHGIQYAYVLRRGEGYPAREEYFVAAPARVDGKTRYGIDHFNSQWEPEQYAIEFPAA